MDQNTEKAAHTINQAISVMLVSVLAAVGGTLLWSNREDIQSRADELLEQVSWTKMIKDKIQPYPVISPDQVKRPYDFNGDMFKAARESWNFKPQVQIPQPQWVPPPMPQPTWVPHRFPR